MSISETIVKLRFASDTKAIDGAKGKIGEIKTALGSIGDKLGIGGLSFGGGAIVAAGAAAGIFANKMREAADEAYRISKQLEGIGVTTGKGFAVVEAFERVGKGSDQAMEAMTKAEAFRTKALEGETNMVKAAGILGLSIEQLQAMDSVDILQAIGKAFADGSTAAERWAAQVALGEQALRNVSALGGIGAPSDMSQMAARWGGGQNQINVSLNQAAREGAGWLRTSYEATVSNISAISQVAMGDFDLAAKNFVAIGYNFDDWLKRNIEAENMRMERMRKEAAEVERIAREKDDAQKKEKAFIDYQMEEERKRQKHDSDMRKRAIEMRSRQDQLDKEAADMAVRRRQVVSEFMAGAAQTRKDYIAGLDPVRMRSSIIASSQTGIGGMFGATVSTTDYADQSLETLKEIARSTASMSDNLSS